MDIKQTALALGLNERTVENAVKENRMRYERSPDGTASIPDDEIRPLSKAQIQAVLWSVVKARNEPNARPDISGINRVTLGQMKSVFKQMAFRSYLDGLKEDESVEDCYRNCRITEKGMSLLQKPPLPGIILGKRIREATFSILIGVLKEKISQWVCGY